jgi:hypothetical protein
VALSNRFNSDPAARALAAQFVLLKVVTEDPKVWSKWSRKYRSEGAGIPKIYVVRADGKQLYGKSGAPRALPQFLKFALNAAGRIPSRAELTRLLRDLKSAQQAVNDGAIKKATTVLGRSKTAGVYSETAIALRKLRESMLKKGKAALAVAEKKIKDPKTTFDGLSALLEIERNYSRLPILRKQIVAVIRSAQKNTTHRALLEQAKLVDRANQYEKDKRLTLASKTWQAVLTKFPNTSSAKLAAERLAALQKK